jgi:hypothetical protein
MIVNVVVMVEYAIRWLAERPGRITRLADQ